MLSISLQDLGIAIVGFCEARIGEFWGIAWEVVEKLNCGGKNETLMGPQFSI